MTQRKVIAAYQDRDGTYIQVLDDGAHLEWSQPDQGWVRMLPPLPPDALGDVAGDNAEIKVGDRVVVAGCVGVGVVHAVAVDVEWPDHRGRQYLSLASVTKVQP